MSELISSKYIDPCVEDFVQMKRRVAKPMRVCVTGCHSGEKLAYTWVLVFVAMTDCARNQFALRAIV